MYQGITVVGYLGKDAEEKVSKDAEVYFTCSVGCNATVKGNTVTTWYRFITKSEPLAKYLTKGKMILVSGELIVDSYENSMSKTITTLEIRNPKIQLLGASNTGNHAHASEQSSTPNLQKPTQSFVEPDGSDDLPF